VRRRGVSAVQLSLLEPARSPAPPGFEYRAGLLTTDEEAELVERFRGLAFREFEFHGFLGRRRVVSFGLRYDFADRKVHSAEEIPEFLLPLRDQAGCFAGVAPPRLEHALVTEYAPGAAIGWHRDRPFFGDVIGVSFLSPCRFRFRQKGGGGWRRIAVTLEPRSAYVLRGPARGEWEHSIPPAEELRYSVTFRTVRSQ
jgi:alkylated DNA repair dioxygenase AlkB